MYHVLFAVGFSGVIVGFFLMVLVPAIFSIKSNGEVPAVVRIGLIVFFLGEILCIYGAIGMKFLEGR